MVNAVATAGKITLESWNSVVRQSELIKAQAEKAHRLRCKGNIKLQPVYEGLMLRYAWLVSLLRLANPQYIDGLRDEATAQAKFLERKLDTMWKLSETETWNDKLQAQFEEMIGRHIRLLDQAEALK